MLRAWIRAVRKPLPLNKPLGRLTVSPLFGKMGYGFLSSATLDEGKWWGRNQHVARMGWPGDRIWQRLQLPTEEAVTLEEREYISHREVRTLSGTA